LRRALADPRVILLGVVYFALVIGGYGLDFFQPTLIRQALPAATPRLVGAINAVPQLAAALVMIAYARPIAISLGGALALTVDVRARTPRT
jgi:ACS family tartrate transporter-like MFS transporter